MQQYQELIDKVREFRYLKVRERQINNFKRLLQKQEGNITFYKKRKYNLCRQPPNPQPRWSTGAGSAQPIQAGLSPSPSNGALATTAPDNCCSSQLGDVAGNTRDQGGGHRVTTVPDSTAMSSPDNTSSDALDQGLRPRSIMEAPQPQPQLELHHTQPGPSRGITPTRDENNLDYSTHKWVKN